MRGWVRGLGAPALLMGVHGGVGGVLQGFLVGAVFGIDGESDAGRAMNEMAVQLEGLVETALEANGNLVGISPAAEDGDEHDELVAANPGENIIAAQLEFHAMRHFLQVEVTDAMAVAVIDLLEAIEIEIDEAEDAFVAGGSGHELVEVTFHAESVGDVGEQVVL